jgi:hypothetical protein
MDDGGHPHCEVSPWGLMSDGRADQGRRHDQVGKRRHQAGNEKDDGGRQKDGERQGNDIEAVGRTGHPRHPVERSQRQVRCNRLPRLLSYSRRCEEHGSNVAPVMVDVGLTIRLAPQP